MIHLRVSRMAAIFLVVAMADFHSAVHAQEAPFDGSMLPSVPTNRQQAESCLATAIYYESANELRAGKEAVAQVVLNRTRHPAFPKTVCGVVWQGAERATGCQFSFTCDNSTARPPAKAAWLESVDVARQALTGFEVPGLEQVLNYHAAYVRPYWASGLRRIVQVGQHIFYAPVSPTRSVSTPILLEGSSGEAATGAKTPRAAVWGIDLRTIKGVSGRSESMGGFTRAP